MANIYSQAERRKFKRIPCSFSVKLDIAGTDEPGRASNLSSGGCLVEFKENMPIDLTNHIEGKFELPYTLAEINIKAKVIRQSNEGKRLALEFLDLTDKNSRIITQYVRDFDNDE